MSSPKLAHKVVINQTEKKIYVDGEEVPWFLADEELSIVHDMRAGLSTVYLPLITEIVGVVSDDV